MYPIQRYVLEIHLVKNVSDVFGEILPFCNTLVKTHEYVTIRENVSDTWLLSILQLRDKLFILWKHLEYCFKSFFKRKWHVSSSLPSFVSKKAFELSWQIFENLVSTFEKWQGCWNLSQSESVKPVTSILFVTLLTTKEVAKGQRMYPIQRYNVTAKYVWIEYKKV